jgi:hypothetical protein
VLTGPLRLVKALTLILQERGLDSTSFQVQFLSVSGNRLTPRWRGLLEAYWGVPIIDVYGLSEVPGLHAVSCAFCGHMHFSPLAHVEVLRVDRDEAVQQGIGRMIATSLYPLARLQPVIRYDTEDLVEIVGPCSVTGQVGYDYLGRRGGAVFANGPAGKRLLLAPTQLRDALDIFPDIAINPHSFVALLGLHSQIGFQRWQLESTHHGADINLELAIELTWHPLQFPDAVVKLENQIRTRINAESPALAEAVNEGTARLKIRFCDPGTTEFRAII